MHTKLPPLSNFIDLDLERARAAGFDSVEAYKAHIKRKASAAKGAKTKRLKAYNADPVAANIAAWRAGARDSKSAAAFILSGGRKH